jgi:hypothetical protein
MTKQVDPLPDMNIARLVMRVMARISSVIPGFNS